MARRNNGFGETEAARHRIEKIDIYEVTKEEINELCSNSTSDLCLEFAIASVSILASFLCSLLVADFSKSPKAFVVYLVVTILTTISSLFFFILWGRKRKNKQSVKDKILKRPVINNK